MQATITLDVDPTVSIGPLELAWHGIMIAVGLAVGMAIARRRAAATGRDPEVITGLIVVIAIAGVLGARALYLLEHGALLTPGEWIGANGYSFYGAIIASPLAAAAYLRLGGHRFDHLDVAAFAFPGAMAVGRIGDVINGEHHGPPSDLPWAIRYAHPEALTPDPAVAYHPGGLYEVLLALAMLAILWPLRERLRRPGQMLWAVIGLYAAGRLVMFEFRSDSPGTGLGLDSSQIISIVLMAVSAAGLAVAGRRQPGARGGEGPPGRTRTPRRGAPPAGGRRAADR